MAPFRGRVNGSGSCGVICAFRRSFVRSASADPRPVGMGPRYGIHVTLFCKMREPNDLCAKGILAHLREISARAKVFWPAHLAKSGEKILYLGLLPSGRQKHERG